MHILGIDIGGTGIKAAIVDTATGALQSERLRLPTPRPASPAAIARTLCELIKQLQWSGPLGIGFPAAIQHGVARTAANIDSAFIGLPVADFFAQQTACPVYVANDADVAGLAEMRFGAGQGNNGVVLIITIGTGLGTALFSGGQLFPNTELGHIVLENGQVAEKFASEGVRITEELKWKAWGSRLDLYLQTMENLFWPDLIILGGGVSKKLDKFAPQLSTRAPVHAASFLNQAGVVGAALFAESEMNQTPETKTPDKARREKS